MNPLQKMQSAKNLLNRRDLLKLGMAGAGSSLLMMGACRVVPAGIRGNTAASTVEIADTSERDGSLLIAYPTLPIDFNPAVAATNAAFQISITLFDTLVWVDQTLTPQPMLATAWVHENLLTWTFTLRQGVNFHHGTELSAQDVVYSFERILHPRSTSPLKSVLDFIARIEAVDPYTVRFHLASPNVEFPLLLGDPQASILAQDRDDANHLQHSPSGTGPFMLDGPPNDQQLVFTRNPDYWGNKHPGLQPGEQRVGIDKLYVVKIPQGQAQIVALRNGEVDLLPDVGYEWIGQLAEAPDLLVRTVHSGSYHTLVMRVGVAPFTDVRVRQAVKYALDRPALQRYILQGHGEMGYDHPVPSLHPLHNNLVQRPHDLTTARELLAEAGYPHGFQVDLVTSTVIPGMLELAEAVREQVAPIGITVHVINVPADTYWESYWARAPFHIGSWAFRASIDEMLELGFHSHSTWNESGWHSVELDGLIEEARAEADSERRKALYHEAQELIMEEGGVAIPYFRPIVMAMHQRIQGLVLHPTGRLQLQHVKLG